MSTAKLDFKDSAHLDTALPASKRIYIQGTMHPDVRVPLREISVSPTNVANGAVEMNAAVRVYDTRGPWGDANAHCDVRQGLPATRLAWIVQRGDTVGQRDRHAKRAFVARDLEPGVDHLAAVHDD